MFKQQPVLIDMKNMKLKRFYLWNVGNYEYEIADFKCKVYKRMADTSCDEAKRAFIEFRA